MCGEKCGRDTSIIPAAKEFWTTLPNRRSVRTTCKGASHDSSKKMGFSPTHLPNNSVQVLVLATHPKGDKSMETVALTAEQEQDRDFIRLLFRNRDHIALILGGVLPSLFGQSYPAEDMMFAIEDEWRRADKRRANGED